MTTPVPRPPVVPTDRQLMNQIGNRLEMRRRSRGLSMRRLGILAGLSPSYVCHLEAGRRMPSVPMLYRLAAVLQVQAIHLLPPLHLPEAIQ